MSRWRALLLGLLLAAPATAQQAPAPEEAVVLGLSRDTVSITTNFDGSEILIFGAVKRETPIPTDTELGVVVTVSGPSLPVRVRRKARRFGIWVNTDVVEVDRAPSFYAVATSGPLYDVLSYVEDLRHKVSIPRAIRSVGAPSHIQDSPSFTEALIRIRKDQEVYKVAEGTVSVDEQTLFRTSIEMPAALTEGNYVTRIFLTRSGDVVSSYETTIYVQKVGLERWLFQLSREQPAIYGVLSLVLAIAAGWAASAAFRFIRS
ncbi:TIGR02186 family protein [Sulfitobacter sp. D35]|uniref:TIGR02186 family protein n=1 Tax=Sulfitobacter sp. D35 TaxID=3083252 RepID=UPI00296F44F7|nr:TIGR02186 family protein [Sulfitobacter sp. D35]MDW4499090.1 TIGR02186 family protein [Sulfitobacter sp. D35]